VSQHTAKKKQSRKTGGNALGKAVESDKAPQAERVTEVISTADLREFAKTCFKELQVKWPSARIASPPKN